jgi:hypothetical protein
LWAESRFADDSARNFYLPENIGNWVVPLSSAGLLAALAHVNTANSSWWDELRRNNPGMSGNVFDPANRPNTARSAQQPDDLPDSESSTDYAELDDQLNSD